MILDLCNLIVQEKRLNLRLYFPVNRLKEMCNPYTFIKTAHARLEEKESALRPVKVNEVCFALDGDRARHGRRAHVWPEGVTVMTPHGSHYQGY